MIPHSVVSVKHLVRIEVSFHGAVPPACTLLTYTHPFRRCPARALASPRSVHLLLWRLCWQMLAPPQFLQALLRRLCWQMLVPPQFLQMFLQWLCSHLLWPRLAEPVRCLCLALSSSPDSALSPPWLPAHQQAPRSKACRGNDGSCPAACRDRIGRGPLRSKRFPHHLAAAAAVPALPRGHTTECQTVNLSNWGAAGPS